MEEKEIEKYLPCIPKNKLYELVKEEKIDISIYKQFESYFDKYRFWFSATRKGHLNVIKFLVEVGVDIDIKGAFGERALVCAEINGHKKIDEFLRENGSISPTFQEVFNYKLIRNISMFIYE